MSNSGYDAAGRSSSAAGFYTWKCPGAPARIHLSLSVVERLQKDVRNAGDPLNGRRRETGGVLLGSIESPRGGVEITDYRALPCTDSPDGRYAILGVANLAGLDKSLTTPGDDLAVVGFYRSHLREGICLESQDVIAAQLYFSDPANVFLVIRPVANGACSAGFFFWEQGKIHCANSFMEFPFDAAALQPRRAARRDEVGNQTAPNPPVAVAPAPVAVPHEQTRAKSRLRWLLPVCLVGLLAVIGIGVAVFRGFGTSAIRETAGAAAGALDMQVESRGESLVVRWDRNNPHIRTARSGVLVVRDSGDQPREVPLDADQLRSGSVLYIPVGDRVQFRLEVNGDEKVFDVVLAILKGGRTSAVAAAVGKPGQPISNAAAPLPSPAGTIDRGAGAGAASAGKAARTFVPPLENAQAVPGQRTVYVDPPEVRGIQRNATAALPLPFQAPTAVTPPPPPPPASPRPAQDPQVKRIVETYVNARPIHQVQPSLSPPMQKMLITRDTKMEVRVYVDEKGKVTRAEVISGSNHKILSNAVIGAALAWKFEPARRNGVPQAAESTIVFVFHPPAGSAGR